MLDAGVVFNTVFMMFLLMIPAFVVRKMNKAGEMGKVLSFLILYVAQPCMIVGAFLQDFEGNILPGLLVQFVLAFFLFAGIYGLSQLCFKRAPASKKGILRFMMVFSNCGFMGFPVLRQVLPGPDGQLAVIYATGIIIWFNIFSWTLGLRMFLTEKEGKPSKEGKASKQDKSSLKKMFLNPGVLASLAGLLLFALSAHRFIPAPVKETVGILGDLVTPLSMFIIGLRLAEVSLKELFLDWRLWAVSAWRLVAAPLLVLGFMALITATGLYQMAGIMQVTPFLLMAMPAATSTVIMPERFGGGDPRYASAGVALSTILSVATIPLLSLLL